MKKLIIGFFIGVICSVPLTYALSISFSDVSSEAWYGDAVSNLVDMGVIEGYEDSTFRPGDNVNRAEFAVMLDRFYYYLQNGSPYKSPKTYKGVEVVSELPEENDSFSMGNDATDEFLILDGDILTVNVGYSGGCATHDFDLLWLGNIVELEPVEVSLNLTHDAHSDMCDAFASTSIEYDISSLREFYEDTYGKGHGSIIVYVFGKEDESEYVLYEF